MNPARLQKALHAVVTRFAIHVAEVFLPRIEGAKIRSLPLRTRAEKLVEKPFPRRGVNMRRPGHNSIEIKNHRVELRGRNDDGL